METTVLKTMIGKRLGVIAIVSILATAGAQARADDVKFAAEVDRNQIGLDDSVSLKFTVQTDGSVSTSPPQYQAPGFEEINSYESSFVESYYDSNTGRISMRNNMSLTKVLRPSRTGALKISQIEIQVNGKTKRAPDLVVQVGASGSGTPPPRNYGGGGVGLRGALKVPASKTVFVRAEVDKDKAYKGEQIVVSYYLYRRVRVLNAQVDKFPMLNGFLREEMEMPVMQPRLEVESVVLDGVPYQRSLLARYAAFPLQEGQLKIDPLGLKYTYYAGNGGSDDGEDPFLQFFRQMTPREGYTASEPITINVQPLPADGRPSSFSGAVGDFSIVAATDKTEVRANEAVTLTVKIEGRGNVAAIGQPKAKWPDNVELYDSKGSAKATKAGVGEKDFEILLIPRVPGPLTLPALEFSYFDPAKKRYMSRSTEPIQITVLDAAPGSSAPKPNNPVASNSGAANDAPAASTPNRSLRELKAPSAVEGQLGGLPIWRYLYIFAFAAVAVFAGWAGIDIVRKVRTHGREAADVRAKAKLKDWERLKSDAAASASMPWADVLQMYDRICANSLDAIDRIYGIGARSLPRAEIRRILIEEKGLNPSRWDPVGRLLEFNEMIRFAGGATKALETRARTELPGWVASARAAVEQMELV